MSGAEILLEPGVIPRLLQGLWVTVWIAGVSVALSVPVGLIVGWLMTMKNPVVRVLTRIYLDFIRIMPQLALLFIAFYPVSRRHGIGIWMRPAHACSSSFCGAAPNWAIWCVVRSNRFPKGSTSRRTYWG